MSGNWSIFNTISTGASISSLFNFYKDGYDVDDNDVLGIIQWYGYFENSNHETSSISVETAERWGADKYGSNMFFKTTAPAAAAPAIRIAIEDGNTKIQNGDLRVDYNLYVTGNIYNLNNVGRFSSKLVETNLQSYTGLTDDFTIVSTYATAGNVTIVLPVASSFPGRIINVKSMTNSSLSIKVTNGSGDSIVYASEPPALGRGDVVTVQSNGSNTWYVIAFLNVP